MDAITPERISEIIKLINKLIDLIEKKKKKEERQKAKDQLGVEFLKLVGLLIDIASWNAQLDKDPQEKAKLDRANAKHKEVTEDYEKAMDADRAGDEDKAKEWLIRTKDNLEKLRKILDEIARQKKEKLRG